MIGDPKVGGDARRTKSLEQHGGRQGPELRMDAPEVAFELRYTDGQRSAVYAGEGLLATLGTLAAALQPRPGRAILCSDDRVLAAQGEAATAALRSTGLRVETVTIPAGEEQKHLGRVAEAYARFAALRAERGDVVVVLGGGVPGDLFGFVAASYLRGLRLIQVPTTLVAQVDSSIGGKVGVDLPEGKNLVGAFKHPQLVLIDYRTLETLPQAEWVAGTAEILKSGVIADAWLFEALAADPAGWRERTMAAGPILDAAVRVKARIVQEDERETGLRMTLNYGHTIGHALEQAAGYQGIRHGEAVAWGMAAAARLASALGLSDAAFVARQDRVLKGLGLLQPLPALDAGRVYKALFLDKKVAGGRLRWVLPLREPGAVAIRDDVPLERVRSMVEAATNGTLLAGAAP